MTATCRGVQDQRTSTVRKRPRKERIQVTAANIMVEVAAEQPILWLGMTGFAPAQRTTLEAFMASATGTARWRVCAFGEADAWWVNGANVRVIPGGNLKVAAGLPTERALSLDLK